LARDPGAQRSGGFLCERVAAATNVLSMRKRSGSNNCFICAKGKRQEQLFYLCESEAAATTGFCLRESEAAAAKRPVGTEINPLLQ